MANNFEGFSEKTNDILMGIRFNNNKEWFHENKEDYDKYVHLPMSNLADAVYEKMQELDKNFKETPKISRANRDIRFSKDKRPYKERKWFFFRADGKPDIIYDKPTYCFEISPEFFRYGLFYAPSPQKMAAFRKSIDKNPAAFERLIDYASSLDKFPLEGELYKRNFKNEHSEKINLWYQRKWIELICYCQYSNSIFYKPNLADLVFEDFKSLYPIYEFFNSTNNL